MLSSQILYIENAPSACFN